MKKENRLASAIIAVVLFVMIDDVATKMYIKSLSYPQSPGSIRTQVADIEDPALAHALLCGAAQWAAQARTVSFNELAREAANSHSKPLFTNGYWVGMHSYISQGTLYITAYGSSNRDETIGAGYVGNPGICEAIALLEVR